MSIQKKLLTILLVLIVSLGCGVAANPSIQQTQVALEAQQTALVQNQPLQQTQIALAAQQTALAQPQSQVITISQTPPSAAQGDPSIQQTQIALAVQQTAFAQQQSAAVATTQAPPVPSGPMFTASQNAFCRQGPSTHYKDDRQVNKGQAVTIIGKSNAHSGFNWWFVQVPDGKKCYVSDDLGTTSGNTSNIPEQTPPFLADWSGVWNTNQNFTIEFRFDGSTFEWDDDWNTCAPGFDSINSSFNFDESLSGQIQDAQLDSNGDCFEADLVNYKIQFAVGANHNQFVGTAFGDDFCGSRNGLPLPNPCGLP
jgi:hypothetical protein